MSDYYYVKETRMRRITNRTLKCIAMNGVWDQAEGIRNDGLDAQCNCMAIFVSDDGTRLELRIKDWEFARLAQSGKPFELSASVALGDEYELDTTTFDDVTK